MVEACKATRKNGQPCQALAGDDGFCFGHSPRLAEARRGGSSRGGKHKRSEARAARLLPEALRPILHHLIDGMVAVVRGSMDPRVGSTLASMAAAVVRVYEAGLLEEKVRELEALHGPWAS
jgi:hypothetical protein